ncbi:MAG: DAK2 domain-containing protein [Nocardia sp.]|nr:DAK2 domain-containing protein [Nocardia sp.]
MRAAVATAERAVLDAKCDALERQVGQGALAGEEPSSVGDHRAEVTGVERPDVVAIAAERADSDVPSAHLVAQALARGATTGARGNSGIILSQVLRGIAEAVLAGPLTGERLRVALRRAAVLVRTGLSAPVEGTILTVLDRAAVAAAESGDQSLVTVARSAADGAARALSETPAQLGVLRAAGVVDAGARGLLVLLDCLVTQVCGEPPERVRYTRGERGEHGPHRRPGSANLEGGGHSDDGANQRRRETDGADPAGSGTDRRSNIAEMAPDRSDAGTRIGVPASSSGGIDQERAADGLRCSVAAGQECPTPDYLDDRDHHEQADDPHFEVMYVISGTDETAASGLRDRLAVLGDSVVVVGDGETTWSAHVHCRDAGAAIEAGLAVGTVTGIRIESFAVTAPHDGHHEHVGGPATGAGARDISARTLRATGADDRLPRPMDLVGAGDAHDGPDRDVLADRGVLAVVAGAGAARLFEDAGAVVLRGDRQLDTSALLTAIRRMPHREVLVLPNGALPAQELVAAGVAARDGSRDVLLLPSASMVQGLAALAVHDRGRIAVDDAFAMSEAAATTRWGALRAARVRALTMVGMCSPGDGLGLVGHDVVVIDPDVVGAGHILLDRMLGLGGELVTLLMGAEAGPELAQVLADHVTAGFPGVEVVVYSGGQQADLVQIGVE